MASSRCSTMYALSPVRLLQMRDAISRSQAREEELVVSMLQERQEDGLLEVTRSTAKADMHS